MALPSFTTFTAFTKIKSSEVNANFTSIYNVLNGNIENANVAAAAAIARTKLASGTAYRILANTSAGVMSENAALTAAHVVYADANGQLAGEASLAVTRGGTGLSAAALGDLIYGSAANTLSRLTGNTTTTQKFLRQVGDGVNSAAPSWEQVSLSAGVTGTLPIANGGTGQTSATAAFNALHPMTTTGDMIYSSSGSTAARLPVGSSGQVLKSVGGVPTWATFSGGINYLSSNPDAESDTSGWSTYADAAGSTPVDGTGGSPTETWTRTTSSPLRGAGSFLLTKDAANRQGEGVAFAMTIDSADQAKILQVDFDYTVASGTYATGDLTVYLYDVTNAVVIQPAGYQIQNVTTGLPNKHIATFQTSSNSTSYRFIIHTASTSASAYTVKFDNFRVGPQVVQYGAPITDWVSYTPTGVWTGTYTGKWRRVGDTMECDVGFTATGATSGTQTFSLPSGYTIDTAKLSLGSPSNENTAFGFARFDDAGVANYPGTVVYSSTTAVQVFTTLASGTYAQDDTATATKPFTWASGDKLTARFWVPISGWSSTVQMSNDTDTRVVSAVLGSGSATLTSSYSDVTLTVVNDTHGAFSSATYTIPVSGYYRFEAQCRFSSSGAITATNAIGLQFTKNGSAAKTVNDAFLSTTAQWCHVFYEALFTAGDTVKLQAKNQNASPTFDVAPTVYIQRLTGPSAIAASETVACRYYASATSLSGSLATISWTTKDYDTHNAMSSGTFTVPVAGKYRVNACLAVQATYTANHTIQMEIQKTAATKKLVVVRAFGSMTDAAVQADDLIDCVAGDTLRVQVLSEGTSPSIVSSNTRNVITIARVGT